MIRSEFDCRGLAAGLFLFTTAFLTGCVREAGEATAAPPAVDATAPVASLVTTARKELAGDPRGDEERGNLLLAAALTRSPADPDAIALAESTFRRRLDDALARKDWSSAADQIEGYDATLREAAGAGESVEVIDDLLTRRRTVRDWSEELSKAVLAEANEVRQSAIDADAALLAELQMRLGSLSIDRLDAGGLAVVNEAASAVEDRRQAADLDRLRQALAAIEPLILDAEVNPDRLAAAQAEAQEITAEALALRLNGTDAGDLPDLARSTVDALGERLRATTVSRFQAEADETLIAAIASARQRMQKADYYRRNINKLDQEKKTITWQRVADELVAAETTLGGASALASDERTAEARAVGGQIAREAIAARLEQQKDYNLWAISLLEAAMKGYNDNRGYIYDDKSGLYKGVKEHLAPIDPQHLHPATMALYSDIYQKHFAALPEEMKIGITRDVETALKKSLSAF